MEYEICKTVELSSVIEYMKELDKNGIIVLGPDFYRDLKCFKQILDENKTRYFTFSIKQIVYFHNTNYLPRCIVFDYDSKENKSNLILQM